MIKLKKGRLRFAGFIAAAVITAAGLSFAGDDAGMIFNTQSNELGALTGGENGDQTGKEARTEHYPLYYRPDSYPWDYLLHCTREDIAQEAATLAMDAAANDQVGYDCGEYACTLWEEAANREYDIASIDVPCAAQCASAVLTFYKCAGFRLGEETLQQIDVDKSVWDMDEVLCGTGLFEKITDSERLHSPDYNHVGDVYVAESRHTVMQITDGAKAQ